MLEEELKATASDAPGGVKAGEPQTIPDYAQFVS